jgi:hypothetical protein
MNNKEALAKQMEEIQAQLAEETARASAPHAIVHVTINNNVPVSTDRNKGLGFTHHDEQYGTITLAKFVGIENHGLETVLQTPTGVKLSAEALEGIKANLNLTCFAQVPLRTFGASKVSGSKLLKIRIDKPLMVTTIQALGKNEMGENCSVFTDGDKLVYLTQEEVSTGIDPKLSPKMTLLATVLFEETDTEERYNPQQSVFNLAITSEDDLLAQLMSDSNFNTAKDASGLSQWRANRPVIDNMKALEDAAASEIANEVLKPATKTRAKAKV